MGFWENFDKNKKLIVAHRGARSIRPENTMSAFKEAMKNSDFIELDVAFSKDGVPVIIHDNTLERTSNVKEFKEFKKPYRVRDYTYKQLLKLDFGSWFLKDDPFKTIENGTVTVEELKALKTQRILTLDQVLKVFKKHNFKLLSLETDIIALKRGMGLFLSDDIAMNIHMRKDKTVFLIVQGDILFAFRELNFGYDNIINYLIESTGEGEDVIVKKLTENKEIFQELPVSESLDKLTIELQRTIDFYNNQFRNKAITKLVLTGSLLKIKGIEKFLSQLFIIKSEKINLLKYLFINVDSELLENLNFLTETIGTGLREI